MKKQNKVKMLSLLKIFKKHRLNKSILKKLRFAKKNNQPLEVNEARKLHIELLNLYLNYQEKNFTFLEDAIKTKVNYNGTIVYLDELLKKDIELNRKKIK